MWLWKIVNGYGSALKLCLMMWTDTKDEQDSYLCGMISMLYVSCQHYQKPKKEARVNEVTLNLYFNVNWQWLNTVWCS